MVQSITAKELEEIYKKNGVRILDVREEDEVAIGKIPEAMHLPMSRFPDVMSSLDHGVEYYVICRTNNRATLATKQLLEADFNATVVSDGMEGWEGKVKQKNKKTSVQLNLAKRMFYFSDI